MSLFGNGFSWVRGLDQFHSTACRGPDPAGTGRPTCWAQRGSPGMDTNLKFHSQSVTVHSTFWLFSFVSLCYCFDTSARTDWYFRYLLDVAKYKQSKDKDALTLLLLSRVLRRNYCATKRSWSNMFWRLARNSNRVRKRPLFRPRGRKVDLLLSRSHPFIKTNPLI